MDVSSRATSHAGALALLNRAFGSTQGCLALRARVQISSSALSVSRPRLFFWQDWKNQNFNRKPQDKKIKVFTPNMYEESSFDLFISLFESQREKESPPVRPKLGFPMAKCSALKWSMLVSICNFFFLSLMKYPCCWLRQFVQSLFLLKDPAKDPACIGCACTCWFENASLSNVDTNKLDLWQHAFESLNTRALGSG